MSVCIVTIYGIPKSVSIRQNFETLGDTCVESGHKNLDRLGKGGLLTRPVGDRSLEVADEVEVWHECRSYVARDLFGPGPHFLMDGNEGLIWETYLAVVFQGCFFRAGSLWDRVKGNQKYILCFKKILVQKTPQSIVGRPNLVTGHLSNR